MNVKRFVESYGSLVFPNRELRAIPLHMPIQHERHSEASRFGIAFNIAFDYELYRRGWIQDYEPRIDPMVSMTKATLSVLSRIAAKKSLTGRDLCELSYHENLVRFNGNWATYLEFKNQNYTVEDIENMDRDIPIIASEIERFLSTLNPDDRLIRNPKFGNDLVDVHGDGDFVLNDTLFEIKCVSDLNIDVKTQKQLMVYKLIHDMDGAYKPYEIRRFGYFNPLKGQIHVWEASISVGIMRQWGEYVAKLSKTS